MTTSSPSPLWRITWVKSRCSSVSGVSSSRLVMPMTPFMGVRISWLIVARNADFASAACSASSLASRSDCSVRLFCVTSM